MWVYTWAFCPVPLTYISVFVPLPYCFDDYSFVVWSEVREPNYSSSVFDSQDYPGYLVSSLFPYKLNFFFLSVLWKMPLIGIALNL